MQGWTARLAGAWRWRMLLALAMIGMVAVPVQAAKESSAKDSSKKDLPAACQKSSDKEDDDDEEDDDDSGVKFDLAGACATLTGGISYTYQKTKQTGSGLPFIVTRSGQVSRASDSNSVTANVGLETARETPLGDFTTSVSAEWSKATGDETGSGTASVTGWTVGLGGLKVGYTGTLMSFWDGSLLSTANSPKRSANIISYEHELFEHLKLAVSIESNLPTTTTATSGLGDVDFSNPVYVARGLYETDDLTVHVAGLVRRADFSASPLLPLFPDTATTRTGWAASLGFKLPLKAIAEDDDFTFQAIYAVDASSYLGTTTDWAMYQSTVRAAGPTQGWSAVGSFHHVFNEQFESNIFASYLALDAELLLAKPSARTFRTGVNLYWKPHDKIKLGAEIGYVDTKLDPQGVLGIFDGASGRATIGYLSLSAEL
jgi:hypothetical protein